MFKLYIRQIGNKKERTLKILSFILYGIGIMNHTILFSKKSVNF